MAYKYGFRVTFTIGHNSKHTINKKFMKKLHLFMSDSQGKEEAQREEDHLTPPPTQEAVGTK